MSKESIQFVEMVREAFVRVGRQTYPMYCEQCGKQTQHTLIVKGDWEEYRCPCGQSKRYRVR